MLSFWAVQVKRRSEWPTKDNNRVDYLPIVIRSPKERAIPWVLLRIRTCPVMVPASVLSTLKFAKASSPMENEEDWMSMEGRCEDVMRLTKQTASIHICRQEVTVSRGRTFRREARHIRRFHDMLQVVTRIPGGKRSALKEKDKRRLSDLRHGVIHIDPILPFEFGPHTPELPTYISVTATSIQRSKKYLSFIAVRRLDVIHDIDMDIVKYDTSFRHIRSFPEDASEDDPSLRR